ncbi:MAG: amidohydrolase family protein [Planctomycetales bacterium]|nr:amidohydrolase family protein [Planctomycetales bacterium]
MSNSTESFSEANRFGWDYESAGAALPSLPFPIWDVHSHLSGARAAHVMKRVMDLFGIERIYSMSQPEELAALRDVLGDRIRFIATPDFRSKDRQSALAGGYARRLRQFATEGVRIAKFWSAPRGVDFAEQFGAPGDSFRLNTPHVQANMGLAVELGMHIMVHISDPDTWFATHYSDSTRYGDKLSQYVAFEEAMDRFPVPFIAAHLGGWPENLEFLSGLLSRHDQLYLDTSATKWMVRELSRHSVQERQSFFERWSHRLLFGSDIVTRDSHLSPGGSEAEDLKSSSDSEAFDLYASRYWALRTLFETDYHGESPIADPDLSLVEPDKYTQTDAPPLIGSLTPTHVLRCIYYQTPHALLSPLD